MKNTLNSSDSGFTVTEIAKPYPVTIFPKSAHYEPTAGVAVALEQNNLFPDSYRLIVRYDTIPVRKVSGTQTPWPNGLVYVSERDVSGWKDVPGWGK